MLSAAGVPIVLHDEEFSRVTPDETWIIEVGRRGWIAVTGDNAITRDPLAMRHFSRSQLYLFVLLGLNGATPAGKAECIRRSYEKMCALAQNNPAPRLWRIGRDGHARGFDFRPVLARMRR